MKGMMTIGTVAKVYGKSYTTVYMAVRAGRLRAKAENGVYLIAPDDAEKWRSSVRVRNCSAFLTGDKQETLNFKVTKTMFEKLHELAAANRKSLSEYCRMALKSQIEKEEESWEN